VRIEADDADGAPIIGPHGVGDPLHMGEIDRAYRAQVLSEDEVGAQTFEEGIIDVIERLAAGERFTDGPIDGGGICIVWRALGGEHWECPNGDGRIALVRAADEEGLAADDAEHLGGGREETDDPWTGQDGGGGRHAWTVSAKKKRRGFRGRRRGTRWDDFEALRPGKVSGGDGGRQARGLRRAQGPRRVPGW